MGGTLIATWGLPKHGGRVFWKPVTYILGGERVENARSDLPLLCDRLSPAQLIIIVLDTAAQNPLGAGSYDELVEDVESLYTGFIRGDLGLRGCDPEIVVAPGAGRYEDMGIAVRGRLSDYYGYTLYALSNMLPDGELTVHLDLTHGINFMPTLTYRALKELLGAKAIGHNVHLTVYNSEPVRREGEEAPIHIVEESAVAPRPPEEPLSNGKTRLLAQTELVPQEERAEVGRRLEKVTVRNAGELDAYLSSLINGLPLALHTFHLDPEELGRLLAQAVEMFKQEIRLERRGGVLEVRRRLSLTKSFAKLTLLKAAAETTAAILGHTSEKEVSLRELEETRRRVYSKTKKLDAMVSRDLKEIRDVVAAAPRGRWVALKELIGGGDFDERNFLAHSGLERNVVEVMVTAGGEVRLRYSEQWRGRVAMAAANAIKTVSGASR